MKFLHRTPVPFLPMSGDSEAHPIPSPHPLQCSEHLGRRDRQESDAAVQHSLPWFGLGGKFHWLLLGSTLHTATTQHPRASFHKALLFPDEDDTFSVILINPCWLCTDQARPASANGPLGGVSLSAPWPQLKEIPAAREAVSVALTLTPRLSCWASWDMRRGKGPLRATRTEALGPKTCPSVQRYKPCHLATGWPPTTSASKKGIKSSVCWPYRGRRWASPMQKRCCSVKASFSSCGPWVLSWHQWWAASLTQTLPASESQGPTDRNVRRQRGRLGRFPGEAQGWSRRSGFMPTPPFWVGGGWKNELTQAEGPGCL